MVMAKATKKNNRTNKEKLCICYIYDNHNDDNNNDNDNNDNNNTTNNNIIIYKNIFIKTYIMYSYIIHDCTHIICQKRILLCGWLVRFLPSLCFTLSTEMRWEPLGAALCLACLGSLWTLWIWKFQRDDVVGSLNIEEDQTLPLWSIVQKSGRAVFSVDVLRGVGWFFLL